MQIVNVKTTNELISVLSGNQSADIRLAPGDYADLDFRPASTTAIARGAAEFRISSEDPNKPAVFDTFKMTGVRNVTIDNVTFDYNWASWHNPSYNPVRFSNVKDLEILNSRFIGDNADNTPVNLGNSFTGHGIHISGATGLILKNNEFSGFLKGIIIDYSRDVQFIENEVHNIRSDGLSFGRVSDVLVKDNYFHSFFPIPELGDHPDMLVIAETGTGEPSNNITIADNVFNARNDNWSQTIFLHNPTISKNMPQEKSQFFYDIEISNNLIVNNHINGIWLGPSRDVIINNNTLVSHFGPGGSARGPIEVPAIKMFQSSYDFEIFKNVTFKVMYDGTERSGIRDNIEIQPLNKAGSNFYDTYFTDYFLTPGTDELPTLRQGTKLTQGGYGVDGTPTVSASEISPGGATPSAPSPVQPAPATPLPKGAAISLGLTEAENLDLAGYVKSGWTTASGGAIVQTSEAGTASGVFDGPAGAYRISVQYVNEDDGVSTWQLLRNSSVMAAWTGEGGAFEIDSFVFVVDLAPGTVIGIGGRRGQGELARVDSIVIDPVSSSATAPSFSGPQIGVGRTEAESLLLDGYAAVSRESASGGAWIETDGVGSASGVFAGANGRYDVAVTYFDESDGRSAFRLVVDSTEEARWSATQTKSGDIMRTFTTQLDLRQGDEIDLNGARDWGEFARIDSIMITPVDSLV